MQHNTIQHNTIWYDTIQYITSFLLVGNDWWNLYYYYYYYYYYNHHRRHHDHHHYHHEINNLSLHQLIDLLKLYILRLIPYQNVRHKLLERDNYSLISSCFGIWTEGWLVTSRPAPDRRPLTSGHHPRRRAGSELVMVDLVYILKRFCQVIESIYRSRTPSTGWLGPGEVGGKGPGKCWVSASSLPPTGLYVSQPFVCLVLAWAPWQ